MPALAHKMPPQRLRRSGAGHPEVSRMPEQAYKRCTKCGEIKPLSEYHRHSSLKDGRFNSCKVCERAKARQWHAANPGRSRQWERENPESVARTRKRARAKRADAERLERQKYQERYPEKTKARRVFAKALQTGKLVKPASCEDCGVRPEKTIDLHGHHHDYSKPLDVEWLCRACHGKRHRAEKQS